MCSSDLAQSSAAVADFSDPPLSAPQQTRVIAVVSIAHALSHFMHLVLPPVFPLLMSEFSLSYSELGLLMTVFFTVSGFVQAASGFVVDRYGPLPVLMGSIALFALSTVVMAIAPSYWVLMLGCAIAGAGNAVNLTDGLDGLAIVPVMIAAATFVFNR